MNKKLVFAAAVCYVAPAAIELEACSEGVLCASGGFSIQDWQRDEEVLEF